MGEVALQREVDAASYREALSSILEETSRLNETVDSLLLLARTEANLGSEDAEVFAICEPVYEIINLLGVLLEDRQIVIQTLGEEKSRTKVKAKRGLLRVALMNVLHNALKFSPDASVLRISYDRPTAPDHRIRLTIEDEGPGIATGEHERIFERFFRGHQQPHEGAAGTGLGLAIARLIIERSGGTIRFDETRSMVLAASSTFPPTRTVESLIEAKNLRGDLLKHRALHLALVDDACIQRRPSVLRLQSCISTHLALVRCEPRLGFCHGVKVSYDFTRVSADARKSRWR